MSPEIKSLPEDLINKISAGEILDRPSSAVKELIENSLDAKSTKIEIDLENGGLSLFKVKDNGQGILKTQLIKALKKFTTSKIYSLDDLQNISSLGFRGEALASIGAVSNLKVISRSASESIGWLIINNGGEISKELNIPKETIRRKVNFLQNQNIIYRKGKSIFFNRKITELQRPANSKRFMASFLEKTSQILSKESWFGRAFSKEEIEAFIDKYFTICWQHWFRMQIPFLVRHRSFFGDLETWNVWGAIGISQFTDYSKQVKGRVVEDPRTYADLYLHLLRHTPKNGINASSISEISRIPRATVIRKLKYLTKEKLVTKNKKLEYMLLPSPKNIKSFEQNYMHNQKHKAGFVTTIFDLMKNSSFKVE